MGMHGTCSCAGVCSNFCPALLNPVASPPPPAHPPPPTTHPHPHPPHPPHHPRSHAAQLLLALGGRATLGRRLRGRLHLSWHYARRVGDVEATHASLGPHALAYQNHALKYAALELGAWGWWGAQGGS